MTARRRFPVAVIVAAALVSVTTLLLGSFGAVTYIRLRDREMATLRRQIGVGADQLSVSLASPTWNIDRAQIDKIIESMDGVPSVYGVVVKAAGYTHLRSRDHNWHLAPGDGAFSRSGLLVAQRPIAFGGESIGTVQVYGTSIFVERELREAMLSMIGTVVALDLLLIVSIYLVLWRAVLRPLGEIERYAVAVRSEATHVPMPAEVYTAELDSVRSSIEAMVTLLGERYTALQESKEALRAETEFTETAINTMTGVFLVQDREGHFIRWNRATERLGGDVPIAERSGRPLVHPDDRAMVQEKLEEVSRDGQAEFEVRMKVPEGWAHFLFNVRRMDARGQQFFVGYGIDITERHRADLERQRLQHELALSATEWMQTFDAVQTPIFITRRDGTIVRCNQAALVLSRCTEEEIVGRTVAGVAAGEPWQTVAQLVSYIGGKGSGTSAEAKDAEGRTWDITVAPFATLDEGEERFILVLWEITGVVELQESLRRSETMSAMGTLVAGVAHEVRNPLFGISATLDAYHDELTAPAIAECGATLRQEVNRLIHLMQELLEYGKPPAMSIERGSVDDVVRQALDSRRPAARAVQVELQAGMSGSAPQLLMDRSRIRQVFENLIDNAIQHSSPGGVVEVRDAVVQHAGRPWVEYRVEDRGPGFANGDLERVFEPFFTQRQGGTGLGLSIVQRIVEEHSGKVTAANRDGGGASIQVMFPLTDSAVTMKTS